MPTFNRWNATWPKTWAGHIFKKHHTQLNDIYWSGAASIGHIKMIARHTLATSSTASFFHLSAANARRMTFPIEDWRKNTSEFENWSRLSALMSLLSYFETYLGAVTWLALTSDPGILLSSSRAVDGIKLVKHENCPDIEPHIPGLTKGDWQSRCAAYKRLFSIIPKSLSDNVSELESMRKLRNGIGHAFGRFIDEYRDPVLVRPRELQRLSESRLQRWLGVIDECVAEIDSHLLNIHIGAFEVLYMYHRWDKKYYAGHIHEETAFAASIGETQGNKPSRTYFKAAIAYYKGV